jgi:hypothetical protein
MGVQYQIFEPVSWGLYAVYEGIAGTYPLAAGTLLATVTAIVSV